jgi:PAS domain S-box-containing protein
MNAIHILSVKTAAAATRLAELEARRERGPTDGSRVVGTALRELQQAIEELRVAIDQLNDISDGLAVARSEAAEAGRRYEEFVDAVPVAALLTDEDGVIGFANEAAADLLNLSARHLVGKPLLLFVADRDHFLRLAGLSGTGTEPLTGELTIRPRDRKARRVTVQVQHLPAHGRRSWFFTPREIDATRP